MTLKPRLTSLSIVLLVALTVVAHSPARAGSWDVDINFLLGAKYLNNDWDFPEADFSTMGTFGVNTSWAPKEWPVRIAADVLGNAQVRENVAGSGGDLTAGTSEFAFGVRKIWKTKATRPYLGGGLNVTYASIEAEFGGLKAKTDGNAVGAWVNGGVFWRLGKRFNIGFDLRYSVGEPELAGEKIQAGGLNTCLILGFGF